MVLLNNFWLTCNLGIQIKSEVKTFQSVTSIGSIPGGNLIPGIQIVVQGVAPAHSEGWVWNNDQQVFVNEEMF